MCFGDRNWGSKRSLSISSKTNISHLNRVSKAPPTIIVMNLQVMWSNLQVMGAHTMGQISQDELGFTHPTLYILLVI